MKTEAYLVTQPISTPELDDITLGGTVEEAKMVLAVEEPGEKAARRGKQEGSRREALVFVFQSCMGRA